MDRLPLREVVRVFHHLSRESFLLRYPEPVLVVVDQRFIRAPEEPETTDTLPSDGLSDTADVVAGLRRAALTEVVSGRADVVPLRKTDRNPFSGIVTCGRANENDVMFREPTVSKVHAVFGRLEEGWSVADRNSTNGTWLDSDRLKPEVPKPIRDGHVILFGPDVAARFFRPKGFRIYLRMASAFLGRG